MAAKFKHRSMTKIQAATNCINSILDFPAVVKRREG
jgi:hypothetical protein